MQPTRHRWDPVCEPPRELVRPVPVDPSGKEGPTPAQVRGPHWRRSSRGLYVPDWVDPVRPEQRILEQSMRLTGGAVTGWAACRMHGAAFFDGLRRDGRTPIAVPLNCGPLHQIRPQAGGQLLRDTLTPYEIEQVRGVPCTWVARATFDVMRFADSLREAVVGFDMMAAARLVCLSGMSSYVTAHQAWTGIAQCREALTLADEGSRSPPETRMRLHWVLDADRPRPLVNRPVFDLSGRLLGYPDLFDPEAGVIGEYDGEGHRDIEQHSGDVDREARFRDHDLEVVRVTGPDMRRPRLVVERISSGYRRARRVPASRRTWTLTPPPWWPRELSLDERLAGLEWSRGPDCPTPAT